MGKSPAMARHLRRGWENGEFVIKIQFMRSPGPSADLPWREARKLAKSLTD